MTNPRDLIEQSARRSANDKTDSAPRFHVTDNEAATSIAISLKRIADALHGTLESTGLLQYVDEMSRQQRGH